MTATNHVLTGLVIGAAIHQPLAAIPIAFASHFVCDALPHFGFFKHTTRGFATLLAVDCSMAALLLLLVLTNQPDQWLLLIVCGIAAASPDLMWLPGYIRELRGKKERIGTNVVIEFHKVIQWAETPKGAFFEIVWAAGMTYVLASLLR